MRHFFILSITFLVLAYHQSVFAGCLISQNTWNSTRISDLNYGQSFTADCDGVLESITVSTFDNNGVPAVTVEIYNGPGGVNGDPILSESFSASSGSGLTAHTYVFTSGPTMATSNTYSIIFNTMDAQWAPTGFEVTGGTSYSGGGFITNNTSVADDYDLQFSINISYSPGDIDGNDSVELKDAILSLQIISGVSVGGTITTDADVNNDGVIGLAETIFILGELSS